MATTKQTENFQLFIEKPYNAKYPHLVYNDEQDALQLMGDFYSNSEEHGFLDLLGGYREIDSDDLQAL